MSMICWRSMPLVRVELGGLQVARGEQAHLILPKRDQFEWLRILCERPGREPGHWQVWLETEDASFQSGTPEFVERIGTILHQVGLMANLSLLENMLLPFLYQGDEERIEQARQEIDGVAELLGLEGRLHEKAGERSSYTHARISLGRCLLQRPDFMVVQDVHVGLSPERQLRFREMLQTALQRIGCGLIYLSVSEFEGSGISFDYKIEAQWLDKSEG